MRLRSLLPSFFPGASPPHMEWWEDLSQSLKSVVANRLQRSYHMSVATSGHQIRNSSQLESHTCMSNIEGYEDGTGTFSL